MLTPMLVNLSSGPTFPSSILSIWAPGSVDHLLCLSAGPLDLFFNPQCLSAWLLESCTSSWPIASGPAKIGKHKVVFKTHFGSKQLKF